MKILATETSPATSPQTHQSHDSKISRLLEIFGNRKSLFTLSEALKQANGSIDTAIRLAAASNDSTEEPFPKKRRLVKKKDLLQPPDTDSDVIIQSMQPSKRAFVQREPFVINSSDDDSITIEPSSVSVSAQTSIRPIIDISSPAASSPRRPNTYSSDEESSEAEASEIDTKEFDTCHYFNTFTKEDFIQITGCSQEQAQLIIEMRPFSDFEHLENSMLKGKKKLSSVLQRYTDMTTGFEKVDKLIDECRIFGDELSKTLENWELENPNLSLPDSHMLLNQQPEFVPNHLQLKSYQLTGVSWLNLLYSKNLSGILADEMGLGKTAQVVVFLGMLLEKGITGPHLIIAPSSTLENWLREIEQWCPSLNFRSYYGAQAERFESQTEIMDNIKDINVIVTTYNMATGGKEDRSFLRRLRCTSMILDEGHMMKNMSSSRYKHLSSFDVPFRLLLTGTPLQNNLLELLSLLVFIMPDLFSDDLVFLSKIFGVKKSASGEDNILCQQRIHRAKEMMTPFILRRRKDQVLSELPKKIIAIENCQITDSQKAVYQKILNDSKKSYQEAKSGQSKQLSNVLMQLRKAANHPLLIRSIYDDALLRTLAKKITREPEYCDANREYIFEDMSFMSDFELHTLCKKFKSIESHALNSDKWMDSGKINTLSVMLEKMKKDGDRILIFSQFVIMLDILENVLDTLGVRFVRLDGSTNVSERQTLIDEFNNDPLITVFLISTKAGGVGINLTSANVVIIYDMDFNPHNDAQAEDRAHRVGQLRDVRVYKFVLLGTVEESILKIATTKIKLDQRFRGSADNEDEDGAEDEDDQLDDEKMMDILRIELTK